MNDYGLRDIHGLDPASWWPPALGWWLILAGLLTLPFLIMAWQRWGWRLGLGWRSEAKVELHRLRGRLAWADARDLAADLSELLRRISMARYSRRSCAGLVGDDWLAWLEAHDPDGFRWTEKGRPLIDLPYAPPGQQQAQAKSLAPLLKATRAWLRKEKKARRWGRSGPGEGSQNPALSAEGAGGV